TAPAAARRRETPGEEGAEAASLPWCSRCAPAGKVGPVGRARELPDVEPGPDLHVATGLAVVLRHLVLVEEHDPRVLHPRPVPRRHREQRPARVTAAD